MRVSDERLDVMIDAAEREPQPALFSWKLAAYLDLRDARTELVELQDMYQERDEARAEDCGPRWCCCECGSSSGFKDVIYRTEEGDEYDIQCEECKSLHVAESPEEAAAEMGVTIDDLHSKLSTSEHERDEARADAKELQDLFSLQQTRMGEATKRWQDATGEHNVLPDLGELLAWLMSGWDEARAQLAACREAVTAYLKVHQHQLRRERGCRCGQCLEIDPYCPCHKLEAVLAATEPGARRTAREVVGDLNTVGPLPRDPFDERGE